MEIRIIKESEHKAYYDEILNMLILGDEEFVPPLSARSSTTQSDWKRQKKQADGVTNYFEELKKQRLMVATENGKLQAFVSFRENFKNDKITVDDLPNIYLSTLIVHPDGRGKGLTQKMYEILFKEYESANIFTRTWSTNAAHIKILSKFDFEILDVLKNDRGQGIDTIYFKRSAVISK